MKPESLLNLIDAIYSAGSDPAAWPAVAAKIQSLLGGHSVNLVMEDTTDERFTCVFSNGVPDSEVARYVAEIRHRDTLTALMNSMPQGTAFMSQDFFDIDALHTLYCYESFYEAIGYTYFNAGIFHHHGGRRGWISVVRSERDRQYNHDEQWLMQQLLPHLHRAFQINAQLLEARLKSRLSVDALEHVGAGVALLDGKGEVIQHNRCAEAYLAPVGMAAKTAVLRLPDAAANLHLQRLVGGVAEKRDWNQSNVIPFNDNGCRKLVLCFPWHSSEAQLDWLARLPCCIVFIMSPPVSTPSDRLLRDLFGLSVAEIKVLNHLLEGMAVDSIAPTLYITVATVRFHIRNLLRKTGTRSQAELVARVFDTVSARIG